MLNIHTLAHDNNDTPPLTRKRGKKIPEKLYYLMIKTLTLGLLELDSFHRQVNFQIVELMVEVN